MSNKHNPYDENGNRIYSTAELGKVFGYAARYVQRGDYIILDFDKRYVPTTFHYACTTPLRQLSNGKLRNPIVFVADDRISKILELDFGTQAKVESMLGRFDDEQKLFIPIDSTAEIQQAPPSHVLMKVRWRQSSVDKKAAFAKAFGALEHCSIADNKGQTGVDFWVLPMEVLRQKSGSEGILDYLKIHLMSLTESTATT